MKKKLKIYEEKCNHCSGIGTISRIKGDLTGLYGSRKCKYCNGRGRIDWIDKLKKKNV